MLTTPERIPANEAEPINFCFLNPALMPEWFWLPTAHAVERSGADYFIPPFDRDKPDASVQDSVEVIKETMRDKPAQYIVALSRGVEYAVRYLDQLHRQDGLQKVLGWTVISSAGPRGYDAILKGFENIPDRHTPEYSAAVSIDEDGLEVIDTQAIRSAMLHDVDDRLSDQILHDLTRGRPLTPVEVDRVPHIEPGSIPLTWYIGRYDRTDNLDVSAAIARQIFRVDPVFTEWGHLGPLTHTDEVAEILIADASRARNINRIGL